MTNELPSMAINLKTIGVVRNEMKEPPGPGYPWEKIVSDVVVDSSLSEALDGLEGFSHLIVLYWMHRKVLPDQLSMKIHPRHREELPLVGFFATRTAERPNLVGQTTVELIQRRGNILKVRRLDAIDGTPVIDIKPYIPRDDMPTTEVKVPQWVTKL